MEENYFSLLQEFWQGFINVTWNLNKLVLIFKNWPNDPHFGCETFVEAKLLNNFQDVEVDLLE